MRRNSKVLIIGLFMGISVLSHATVEAEPIVLPVDEVIQEESQWCWAATSTAVLNYYLEENLQQCEIAEYTRTVADWYDFGSVDCCISADLGCNYWNYLWHYDGSVEEILWYWELETARKANALKLEEVTEEITDGTPFIFRWKWVDYDTGHFLVMHGVDGEFVYYMDPWIGEGYHVGLYDWVVKDSVHWWTHTLMTEFPDDDEGPPYGPSDKGNR